MSLLHFVLLLNQRARVVHICAGPIWVMYLFKTRPRRCQARKRRIEFLMTILMIRPTRRNHSTNSPGSSCDVQRRVFNDDSDDTAHGVFNDDSDDTARAQKSSHSTEAILQTSHTFHCTDITEFPHSVSTRVFQHIVPFQLCITHTCFS